jgi:hypothetical protein
MPRRRHGNIVLFEIYYNNRTTWMDIFVNKDKCIQCITDLIKKEDNITSYILNYEEDIDYLVWSMQFYSFEDT